MQLKTHLISEYKSNNKFDIKQLINDYQAFIYKIIKNMSFCLTNEDIEEIIEDVFLVIWNNKEKLNAELPIEPYIIGVTKNLVKEKFHKLNINYNLEDYEELISDSIDTQLLIEQKEKNNIISVALDKMSSDDKRIFILFYFYQKSTKEIANELNVTNISIKTKLHRIRKRIKKSLIEGGYSYE